MKPKFRPGRALCLCAALVTVMPLPSQAAPAPWYLWRSQLDGALSCQQFSPGQAWSLDDGPFADPACLKRMASRK